ncbi:hypothetical protein ACI5KX_14230 [Erythrobacter sp. GH1-10]|uniref:hypothetical protein n=1 Tax=Erythrobacter sp. GH1-10 TaxID=3349334 RepID=UPI003877F8D6
MITTLLSAALLAVSAEAPAPALSQESKALLRCSAAFAIVSHGQSVGNEAALKWPRLDTRGREFFVRSLAQLMDETGLDRDGISALVSTEAQGLWDRQEVDKVMPSCLVMLEASGV